MHNARKLNLKKLYAPQAYHVASEAVCIQKMHSGYVEIYLKMEDQVKHKYVLKPVVELHNVDLPRYTVFIDERGMIEATMHPPVNKYNPQLKSLRIDTESIVDSEIGPMEILGTNC